MKKIFLIALLVSGSMFVSAQLTNTKWKGIANVPDPYESVFDFRKDSLMLNVQGSLVETMGYELRGDTLILTKLDGLSPCGTKSAGHFKITWKDDTFTLIALKDECPERAAAFVPGPWTRLKDE